MNQTDIYCSMIIQINTSLVTILCYVSTCFAESVEDAQGYVIPRNRSQEQEGKRVYSTMNRKCTDRNG